MPRAIHLVKDTNQCLGLQSGTGGRNKWRRKKQVATATTAVPSTTTRKQNSCQICGRVMTSPGHTQYCGQRNCPDAPGQIPREEWLEQKKAEAKAKKAAMATQQQ